MHILFGSIDSANRTLNDDGWIKRGSALPNLVFVNFDAKQIAFELLERVILPSKINQNGHPVCGAAVFIQSVAVSKPDEYVRFVISLAEGNQGTIGAGASTLTVKLRKKTNITNAPSNPNVGAGPMAQADFIAMVTLRDSRIYQYEALRMLAGATLPKHLLNWMKRSGYTDVRDFAKPFRRTLTFTHSERAVAGEAHFKGHIQTARTFCNAGYAVYMCCSHPLAVLQLGDQRNYGSGQMDKLKEKSLAFFGGHWVLLRGVEISGTGVKFKILTWGREARASVEIPWSKIESWYRGFVCGKP